MKKLMLLTLALLFASTLRADCPPIHAVSGFLQHEGVIDNHLRVIGDPTPDDQHFFLSNGVQWRVLTPFWVEQETNDLFGDNYNNAIESDNLDDPNNIATCHYKVVNYDGFMRKEYFLRLTTTSASAQAQLLAYSTSDEVQRNPTPDKTIIALYAFGLGQLPGFFRDLVV